MITPFSDGEIDYVALNVQIERQIKAGVDAIVMLGTTGEPCTISGEQREKIIKFAKSVIACRAKLIVGCGSNSTSVAIEHYRQASALGADGALIVTPYYNKCSKSGLLEHYKAINNSGNLPIIVYNVPSRTGVKIEIDTIKKLAKLSNVCGIKNSCSDIMYIITLFKELKNQIAIYSGDDALNHVYMCLGASGAISVASNIMPKVCKRLINFGLCSKFEQMNSLANKILPFVNSLFIDVNPIPVKAGMSMLGLCKNELKLPLTPLDLKKLKTLQKELNKVFGLEYDCL